ncbi:PIN domain-containing protein [Belliella pelovolcani]|uniref:tRNA(fMet)-specific endonuclease VapC n=1 Tax=Belliella pelovolcani TaxID=529505 RepID=A0A1N7NKH2_9BACT|nr:hypothetical protein [Belliella pelovolcani]SIS98679.1 tRNA(fMet)-specific endonuclease VapC [Belliella pelovolcani]
MIEKFEQLGTENFAISEITLAELVFGAENSKNPPKNLDLIEVFANQVVVLPIFERDLPLWKRESPTKIYGPADQ